MEPHMNRKIFVNLPVSNLNKSKAFFESLGFHFNPQFSDDTAACMVISDDIYSMLLTHDKFLTFAPKPVADAKHATEVLVALSCDSREEVDQLVSKACAAGGTTFNEAQDYGFMYSHAFQDLDGHVWELLWMSPEAAA